MDNFSSSLKNASVGFWQRPIHIPLQPLASRNRQRLITTFEFHVSPQGWSHASRLAGPTKKRIRMGV